MKTVPYPGNIAASFYRDNKTSIQEVRNQLFKNLDKYHPSISAAVKEILKARIEKSGLPLGGELFPHMLKHVASSLDSQFFLNTSTQWMAAYVLTIMIDDQHDLGKSIDGKLVAALHFEASKLQTYIPRTSPYLELFDKLVTEAIRGQITDTMTQQRSGENKVKLRSAKDKNKIFSAFTVVLASSVGEKEGNLLISLSNNFLIGFQLLDDLADIEEDYMSGNKTFLLNSLSNKKTKITRHLLLHKVITSGKLLETLNIIAKSLSVGENLLISHGIKSDNESYLYFSSLKTEIRGLKHLVSSYKFLKPQTHILDQIDTYIHIICQAT